MHYHSGVTKATDKYRLLAASQLNTNDHVLEIGCSNGECSLVIFKYISLIFLHMHTVQWHGGCSHNRTIPYPGLDL